MLRQIYKLIANKLAVVIVLLAMPLQSYAYKYPPNYARDPDSPGITKKQIRRCPVADGFDFPVGKPNAKGYYNAQKFRRNNHLADDWNGVGGGNTDLNDPIYSIANGIVVQTVKYRGPWGRVTRILHNAGTKTKPVYVESLYAHMRKVMVRPGMIVKRGQQIGTIGNANGTWWAHLHLEIRTTINKSIGVGYSRDTTGYVDPTAYIKRHRPRFRYAARKRRRAQIKRARKLLAMKRAALKARRLRRLAKGKRTRIITSVRASFHRMLDSSLNYLASNKAADSPTSELSQAETVASHVWSGSMYAVSICEDTRYDKDATAESYGPESLDVKKGSIWPGEKSLPSVDKNPVFWPTQ